MTLPRLAIVSTGIRRDLLAPLKHFARIEIVHLYRHSSYGDLTAADLGASLRPYHSPYDLYLQLVKADPDIIQGVEPLSVVLQPYLWACQFAALRTGARLMVVTLENRPLDVKYGKLTAALLRKMLTIYFSRASLFIALNRGAEANLNSCGVPSRLIKRLMWGTWGVDVDEFTPPPSGEEEMEKSEPHTILFAGRLHEEKGIFYLLDAFAIIAEKLSNVQLLIAGDGPARARVEGRAAALKGVTLMGAVKNRSMPGIFRGSSVLASPSVTTRKWEEQVGMANIQAMACGLPVVSTACGAIPEYVPDGVAGILVPERNAPALANAILRVLTDEPLRSRLAAAGRKLALDKYDAKKNIEQAETMLLQTLG